MTNEKINVFTQLRAEALSANPKPSSLVKAVHAKLHCSLEYRLNVNEDKAYLIAYCPAKSIPSEGKWPKLKGFEITKRSVSGRDCLAVSVLSSVPKSDILFAENMLSLVGSECQQGLSDLDALEDMLACLAKMQNLAKGRGAPLSVDKQVGLFGELYIIYNYMIPVVGDSRAVLEWVGPSGAPQDFQSQSCALEVKTTRANLPQTIRISSARQLQSDTVPRLYLARIALDIQPSIGETLPDIVEKINSILRKNSLLSLEFRNKLAEVGYYEEHSNLYTELKYQLRSIVFYDVKDGFPRIQEKELNPGIGDVSYEIETGACSDFIVDESVVRLTLKIT